MKTVHGEEKTELCGFCGKAYKPSHLKSHIRLVHEGVKKPYDHKCKLCEKVFSSKQNLNNHTSAVHEGIKLYKCDKCDAEYQGLFGLKEHIKE